MELTSSCHVLNTVNDNISLRAQYKNEAKKNTLPLFLTVLDYSVAYNDHS